MGAPDPVIAILNGALTTGLKLFETSRPTVKAPFWPGAFAGGLAFWGGGVLPPLPELSLLLLLLLLFPLELSLLSLLLLLLLELSLLLLLSLDPLSPESLSSALSDAGPRTTVLEVL